MEAALSGPMRRGAVLRDALRAKRQGPAALEARQRARLAELVAYARARSPLFRDLYRGLPDQVESPALLPATSKGSLLERYDDWATDRELTQSRMTAFVDDPERVGERLLGRYMAIVSSGTSGLRGMVALDDGALAVADALRLRGLRSWLSLREAAAIARAGGRTAVICATHGHFTGVGLARRSRFRRRAARPISSLAPLPELVAEVNRSRPAMLSGYAGIIGSLAAEQRAGRLRIDPVLVATSAETITEAEAAELASAFGAKHRSTYAASECPFIAHSCERGWLHVNADWVVLEPVEDDGAPTPAGERSHGVLLTNLANRAQPLIRYALDDQVLRRPDPCPCGNPLPAIRVQGRTADQLTLSGADGPVSVPSLPLDVVITGSPGLRSVQLVQTGPAALQVRMQAEEGVDPSQAWRALQAALIRFLGEWGLEGVTVERDESPPALTEGGKMRSVVPLGVGGPGTSTPPPG